MPSIRHASPFITLIALALAAFAASAQSVGDYEDPPMLRAADVLPASLVQGKVHRVADQVTNDGFMNRYSVSSRLGTLDAHSTAELRKRVAELNAADALDRLSRTEEFGKHLTDGAERIVSGATALVTNPVDTVSGALTGVGRLLDNANESIFGVGSGDEDQLKALIGFNQKKREYAQAFGVDVYSRNPILQEKLDDVAWAGYAGGITTTAATLAVTGGAGAALTVSSGAELLNREQLNRPPVELRKSNHDALGGMGASADVIELFLGNQHFTLTQSTLLVNALVDLAGVQGRAAVVKLAVGSVSPQVAEFRRRQAQMYATAHAGGTPLAVLEIAGQVTAARASDNTVVFALPVDRLAWTRGLENLTAAAARRSAPGHTLLVAGAVTERARAELAQRGWTVRDGLAGS